MLGYPVNTSVGKYLLILNFGIRFFLISLEDITREFLETIIITGTYGEQIGESLKLKDIKKKITSAQHWNRPQWLSGCFLGFITMVLRNQRTNFLINHNFSRNFKKIK